MANIFGIDLTSNEVLKESSKEVFLGGNFFETSFAGEVKITKAEFKEAKTGTKGLDLTIVDEETGREAQYMTIWFQKKDGSMIQQGINKLVALGSLTKCLEALNSTGPKVLEGKTVGIFLKMTDNGNKYLEKEIEGFFSAKANLTWAELTQGKTAAEGEVVEKFKKKYEETPVFEGRNKAENLAKAQGIEDAFSDVEDIM